MAAQDRYEEPETHEADEARGTSEAQEAMLEAAFRTGSFDQAEQSARAAEQRALRTGDHAAVARARIHLGMIRHYEGVLRCQAGADAGADADADAADAATAEEEALFRSALALAEATSDKPCEAAALLGIGLMEQQARQDWNGAMPYYRRAEALIQELRKSRDRYTESEIHRQIGLYYLAADPRPDRAAHHLRLAHLIRMESGDERLIPSSLTALAAAERARGAHTQAVALAVEAARRAREAGLSAVWVAGATRELRAAAAALTAASA
jgi:hypothetical protein